MHRLFTSFKSFFLFFLLLIGGAAAVAQPTRIEGSWLTGSYTNQGNVADRGGALWYRDVCTGGIANAELLFNSPGNTYSPKWVNSSAGAITRNTRLVAGAIINGSNNMNIGTTTTGRYYTFNIGKNTGASNDVAVLETTYLPKDITSVTPDPFLTTHGVVGQSQPFNVSTLLSAALSVGEFAFVRYSTDAFASNNQFVAMTLVSGSTYQGVIPGQATGTTITYYVFTSNTNSQGALQNQINGTTADYLTLNLRNSVGTNVSGANYSYTVDQFHYSSATGGNYNSTAAWARGATPTTTADVIILNGHTITSPAGITNMQARSIRINTGGVLRGVLANGSPSTINFDGTTSPPVGYTLRTDGDLICNSGLRFGFYGSTANVTHTIVSNDTIAVCGVHNTSLGFVTFLNMGNAKLQHALYLGPRSAIATNAPTYLPNSVLYYSTGGTYECGTEWYANVGSGVGVPYNVSASGSNKTGFNVTGRYTQVDNPFTGGNNNTIISFGTANTYRQALGDIYVENNAASKFQLSSVSGGDLRIGGSIIGPNTAADWIWNGRGVTFNGTGVQTFQPIGPNNDVGLSVNRNNNISYVTIDKPSKYVNLGAITRFCAPAGSGTSLIFVGDSSKIHLNGKAVEIYGSTTPGNLGSGFISTDSAAASLTFRQGFGSPTGDAGSFRFVPGATFLKDFRIARPTGGGTVRILSDLLVNNSFNVDSGTVTLSTTTPVTISLGSRFNQGTAGAGTRILDLTGGGLRHILKFRAQNPFSGANGGATINTGSASEVGNEVWYVYSGTAGTTQNVQGYTYNKLIFAGNRRKRTTGALTVNRRLRVLDTDTVEIANAMTMPATAFVDVAAGAQLGFVNSNLAFPSLIPRSNFNLSVGSIINFEKTFYNTEPLYWHLLLAGSGSSTHGRDSTGPARGPSNRYKTSIRGNLITNTVSAGHSYCVKIPYTSFGIDTIEVTGDIVSSKFIPTSAYFIGDSTQYETKRGGILRVGGNTSGYPGKFNMQSTVLEYFGTGTQNIKAGSYGPIKISGGGDKVIAGINGSMYLKPTFSFLDLAGARLILGKNDLNVLANQTNVANVAINAVSAFSASNCIVTNDSGSVNIFKNTTRFKYTIPLSEGTYYNPVRVNQFITTAATAASNLSFRATASKVPNRIGNNVLNVYWKSSSTGYSGTLAPNLSFTYNNSQVNGDESLYKGVFYTNAFVRKGLPVAAADDSIFVKSDSSTFSGNMIGNWSAGEPASFPGGGPTVYYSRVSSGNWSTAASWSLVALNGAASATAPPNSGANIVIGTGSVITLDVNTVTSITSADVQSGGSFDLVENNPGIITLTGAGKLIMSAPSGSRAFPTFTTNTFTTTAGSEVIYNGAGSYTLPASPTTYQKLTISGGGTKTLAVNTIVAGDLSVLTSGTTFDMSTFTIEKGIASGNTLTVASGATLRVGSRFPGFQTPNNYGWNTWTLTGSTVDYYGGTVQAGPYHNLTISGNRGGAGITVANAIESNGLPFGSTFIAGIFNPSATNYSGVSGTGGGANFNFNGSGSQTIPTFNYLRLLTTNPARGAGVITVNTLQVVDYTKFVTLSSGSYDFGTSTIEYVGTNTGNVTVRSNPTGFPFYNLLLRSSGSNQPVYNFTGEAVTVTNNLSIGVGSGSPGIKGGVDINTGTLTMATNSTMTLSDSLRDSNISGAINLNNCAITLNANACLDLSETTQTVNSTATVTLASNTGRLGGTLGASLATFNFAKFIIPASITGTLGRGNYNVTDSAKIAGAWSFSTSPAEGTKAVNTFVNNGSFTGVTGNLVVNGNAVFNAGSTFATTSSTYDFAGTAKQFTGTIATAVLIPNMTISGTYTNTLVNGITSNTSVAGAGSLTQAAGALLTFSGLNFTPTLVPTGVGNIVRYNAAGSNMNLPAGTYKKLVLANPSSIATLTGTTVIEDSLIIQAGSNQLSNPSNFLRMANNSILLRSGGFLFTGKPITTGADKYSIIYKNLTLGAGLELPPAADDNLLNLTIDGTTPVDVDKAAKVNGILNITTGSAINLNNFLLTLAGTKTGAGVLRSAGGTSDLTITGTGAFGNLNFDPASNILRNFTLNRTASGTVNQVGKLNVGNTMTLTNGTFATGADTLFLGSGATFSEIDGSSTLLGKISTTRTLNTNSVYNALGGIGLEINHANPLGSTQIVRTTGTSLAGNPPGGPCCANYNSIKRFFDLYPTNNSNLGAYLKVYYQTGELNGQTESNFVIYKAPLPFVPATPNWEYIRASYNAGANLIQNVVPINSFSRITGSSELGDPLPASLKSFAAAAVKNDVVITWSADQEASTARYEIEKSTNGRDFAMLQKVAPRGAKTQAIAYSIEDQAAMATTVANLYYRLKQVDAAGGSTYSPVRVVEVSKGKPYQVYPNPATDVIYVKGSDISKVTVIDLAGKRVNAPSKELSNGGYSIDLRKLAKGIYVLKMQYLGGSSTTTIEKL